MATYYIKLTTAGLAALAAAQAGGDPVAITQFAVGDSGGAYYEPDEAQTALVNEKWRANVNNVYVHPNNPNWIVVEALIPTTDGGFDIREAGAFAADGTLIAVGKYPLTNKPAPGSGSEKDLYVRMILQVSNAANVQVTIDGSLITASAEYVLNAIDDHEAKLDPHPQYLSQQEGESLFSGITHRHDGTAAPSNYAADTGAANAYTIALAPALTAHVAGMPITFKAANANTGASTLTINGMAAVTIKQVDGADLVVGAILAGQMVTVIYTGAVYVLVSAAMAGTTQAQFDSSNKFATDAFVQRAIGNTRGLNATNVSTTLTLADVGKVFTFYGSTASQIITLPTAASVAAGAGFWFVNQGSVAVQVKGNGSEVININTLSGATQSNALTIAPGDSIFFSSNSVNVWNAFGWASNNQFPKLLVGYGYQKLPSGLIVQWGQVLVNANSSVSVSWPIAFPAAVIGVYTGRMTAGAGGGSVFASGSPTVSGAIFYNVDTSPASRTEYYLAIGY